MSRFCAHSSRRAATLEFSVNDVMWNEDGGGRGGGEEIVPVAKMHAVMHFLLQMCLSHFLLKRKVKAEMYVLIPQTEKPYV